LKRFRELRELFGELHWEPREMVEVGARIMVVARVTGVGRTSGASVDESLVHVRAMANKHAAELRVFSTRSEALRALSASADK
jgi:hypothetical protein